MANLSQIRREQMISFLETLKEQHSDDDSLMAINQIEKELTSKKYGLVWEEHEEEVDVKMQTHIPVFTEVEEREIVGNPESEQYNFLLILTRHIIPEIEILNIMMIMSRKRICLSILSGFHLWKKDCWWQEVCYLIVGLFFYQ